MKTDHVFGFMFDEAYDLDDILDGLKREGHSSDTIIFEKSDSALLLKLCTEETEEETRKRLERERKTRMEQIRMEISAKKRAIESFENYIKSLTVEYEELDKSDPTVRVTSNSEKA
jgi:predicted RNase H-like nuclease (RuvC/YqgF family)